MQFKTYQQGTHRIISPERTLEKVQPFLKKMGITRVANITGLDNIGIPVVAACRPNSKSLAVSQGKGHSLTAAKASAVMESIEGYHAENIDLPCRVSSLQEMRDKGYDTIDMKRLARSCERDFQDDISIRWLECKNIRNQAALWIPHEVIHADFTLPVPNDHGFFMADSNGLASGNTIIEAINHGLYEVIERDCLALWQLTPLELQAERRVAIETITEPFLLEHIKKLKASDIYIGVWDITNDLNIPTFICKIVSAHNTGVRPAYGSGTHLDKNVALSRAITEAAQSRLTFISGARDDQYHDVYESEIAGDVYQSWVKELAHDNNAPISFEDIEGRHFEHLEGDQDYVLCQLEQAGMHEAVYVDLSKEEYNIPVVKVVVPGLEGVTHAERRLLGSRGLAYYHQYGVGACEMIS